MHSLVVKRGWGRVDATYARISPTGCCERPAQPDPALRAPAADGREQGRAGRGRAPGLRGSARRSHLSGPRASCARPPALPARRARRRLPLPAAQRWCVQSRGWLRRSSRRSLFGDLSGKVADQRQARVARGRRPPSACGISPRKRGENIEGWWLRWWGRWLAVAELGEWLAAVVRGGGPPLPAASPPASGGRTLGGGGISPPPVGEEIWGGRPRRWWGRA